MEYVRAHWLGKQSLAWSFWINGVVIGFAFNLVLVAVAAGMTPSAASAVLLLVLGVAALAVGVWQLVGCWRSASRHVQETGRQFWARAVQVLVVIGALQWAVTLLQLIGVLPETA